MPTTKPIPKKSSASRTQHAVQIVKTTNWLANLTVPRKLALAGLIATIPFVVTLGSLIVQSNQQTQHLAVQKRGQEMLAELIKMLIDAQKIRLYSVQTITGVPGAEQKLTQVRIALSTSLDTLETSAQAVGYVRLVDQLTEAGQTLETLNWSVDSGSMNTEETTVAYSDFLESHILPMFDQVARSAGMKLTNSAGLSEIAEASFVVMPDNLPITGRLISSTIASIEGLKKGDPIPFNTRENVRSYWNSSRAALKKVDDELQILSEVLPTAKELIMPDLEQLKSILGQLSDKIESEILIPGRLGVEGPELANFTDDLTTRIENIWQKTLATYQRTLDGQISMQRRNVTLLFLAALLLIGIITGLLYVITRSIIQPLQQLTTASQQLSRGDLDVRVPVTTRDEIGTLSGSFNTAVQQLRENAIKNEEDRLEAQRLQQNVSAFLDVTMDIAEGDLTKRGKVTEDALGNVVDSINFMTEELAETLRGVQEASQSVTGGSQTMLSSTAEIEEGASMTVNETQRVAQQALAINAQIQEMAQIAQASAEMARQAYQASQQGREAVETTLDGMNSIRQATQNATERVESLAKRSDQIQEILDSISHIASQTNLLSLHASIEAAGAGEAGNRFTVVAEEVRQLADESAAATGRIATLITGIQAEIREVAERIRESSQQVQEGYTVAGRAGEQLQQIGRLSEESARLAQQISQATADQVRGVESVGQGVQQIAQIAQDAQQSVQEGRSAAQQLLQLAQQLSVSLQRFKLPS